MGTRAAKKISVKKPPAVKMTAKSQSSSTVTVSHDVQKHVNLKSSATNDDGMIEKTLRDVKKHVNPGNSVTNDGGKVVTTMTPRFRLAVAASAASTKKKG